MIDKFNYGDTVGYVFDLDDLNTFEFNDPVKPEYTKHPQFYRECLIAVQFYRNVLHSTSGYQYFCIEPWHTVTMLDGTSITKLGWWWESLPGVTFD